MDSVYIPPQKPPCEPYWLALLEEGAQSKGKAPGLWEWQERPPVTPEIWEKAQKLEADHDILTLTVANYNKGGLIAYWEDIECFIPASHLVAYPFPADPEAREECFKTYISKELRLCVIEVDPSRKRILLSERQVEECEALHTQWPAWLKPGAICEGEVTSVRAFGVFVDIGPLEGMVHISEISWGRVRHPSDFTGPGDNVEVLVLNVDPDNQRVGLSMKRLQPNPWDSVEEHINCGDEMTGKVASIERFGVFVELLDGLEGLLHVSEICKDNHNAPSSPLQHTFHVGQPIDVRVLDITPQEHRIALGLPSTATSYVAS